MLRIAEPNFGIIGYSVCSPINRGRLIRNKPEITDLLDMVLSIGKNIVVVGGYLQLFY